MPGINRHCSLNVNWRNEWHANRSLVADTKLLNDSQWLIYISSSIVVTRTTSLTVAVFFWMATHTIIRFYSFVLLLFFTFHFLFYCFKFHSIWKWKRSRISAVMPADSLPHHRSRSFVSFIFKMQSILFSDIFFPFPRSSFLPLCCCCSLFAVVFMCSHWLHFFFWLLFCSVFQPCSAVIWPKIWINII